MTDLPLIDQISLEDNVAAGLERVLHLLDQAAIEKIETDDEVVSVARKIGMLQIGLDEIDRPTLRPRCFARLLERGGGDVDGVDAKASGGEINCVAAFAGGDVQRPAGRDEPRPAVQDFFEKFGRGLIAVIRGVFFIPALAIVESHDESLRPCGPESARKSRG